MGIKRILELCEVVTRHITVLVINRSNSDMWLAFRSFCGIFRTDTVLVPCSRFLCERDNVRITGFSVTGEWLHNEVGLINGPHGVGELCEP